MKKTVWQSIINGVLLVFLGFIMAGCSTEVTGLNQNDLTDDIPELNNAALVTNEGNAALCNCINSEYPFEELSEAEINALLLMREEEKMARDIYLNLYDQWNKRIFSNIARAEQRHMDVLLCLLQKYELTDPVGNAPEGVFQNETLQSLYNTLLEQGNESLEGAMEAGAAIEDVDIFDLMQLSSSDIDNEDILAAFNELTKGSRNHLRAFNRQLNRLDVTYTPQHISEELFQEIVNSPKERGGSLCISCEGNGNGQGNGNCKGNGNNGNGNGQGNGNCKGNGNNGNGNGQGNGNCNGNGNNGNGNNGNGNGQGNGNGNGNGNNGNGGNGNGNNGTGG